MQITPLSLLEISAIRDALKKAWQDSDPGITGGHEEGGFIVQGTNGELFVMRWPKGGQDTISLSPYKNGKVGDRSIIATFHTHPNTGSDYLQEPGETDKCAVRDDDELKNEECIGEFVISRDMIYHISPTGLVSEIESTKKLLAIG